MYFVVGILIVCGDVLTWVVKGDEKKGEIVEAMIKSRFYGKPIIIWPNECLSKE